ALELLFEVTAFRQIEPQALIEALVVADHDVVEDRERQRQPRALECPRYAGLINCPRARIRDVSAVEHDAPGIGVVDPGNHIEKRSLAGTVRADETEDL